MKCPNCNNEIPDTSNVCPYCHTGNLGGVAPTPVFNVENTSALPVTPTEPILPTDQNLVTQSIPVVTETQQQSVVTNSNPVDVNVNSVNELTQPNDVQIEGQVTTPPQVENKNQVLDAQTLVENAINPDYIDPSGEIIDGSKIGRTVEQPKKKSKAKKIIIIIIILLIIILGGLGYAYYHTQYNTSEKRITAVYNGITSFTNALKTESIEKTSGTYDVDLSLNYNDSSIQTKFNGKYAKDLSAGELDLTLNLNSLTYQEELINNPINLEFYYADSKFYVLLQNFFDKYIYEEYDGLTEYFNNLKKNEINYVTLIKGIKNAGLSGFKSMNNNQSVKDITIHGKSSKENVITINLTAANQKKFVNSFSRSLSNNALFISELSKTLGIEEEKLKETLSNPNEEYQYQNSNTSIEIYTSMFKEQFDGMKIINKEDNKVNVIEIYPTTKGYGISCKSGSQNVFEGTFEKSMKNTSTTKESTYDLKFTVFIEEVAYKVDLNLQLVSDVNPKPAKVNVKNSINKKYLTTTDKEEILSKYNGIGNIVLFVPNILEKYLETDAIEPSSQESCVMATNCISSEVDGYLNCIGADYSAVICQDDWIN